jgi:hypothetical protein
MSKSKPITPGVAIFCGGLIAGILDAADGVGLLLRCLASTRFKFRNSWPAAFMERPLFKREVPAACLVSLPIFHRFHGRRYLRGSNPVSAHAKQGAGIVGHDLRRCRIHCYELCRTTAHSRRAITLICAALTERGSRARVFRWLTDRPGSPTDYKAVQLQYSGGLTTEEVAQLHTTVPRLAQRLIQSLPAGNAKRKEHTYGSTP